jgi:hypothetical protein
MKDDDGTIRFKLDSGVNVYDLGALTQRLVELIQERGDLRYAYVPSWENVETGGPEEDVVVIDGDPLIHLDDPVEALQLLAMLLLDSVPGIEEVDSYWDVDRDEPST